MQHSLSNPSLQTLHNNMYTQQDSKVDILLRTSGESRLSDFLLWQSNENTMIYFTSVLWPEFNFWDFLPVLLHYQWCQLRRGMTE